MLKWIFSKFFKQPSMVSESRRFNEGEVKVVEAAHKVVFAQTIICTSVTKRGLIADSNVVTPWVIGYMVGTLDYATQHILNEPHTDIDIITLFLETHFLPKQCKAAMAIFIAAQHAMQSGDNLFMSGADYIEGAKAGYQQFDEDFKAEHQMPLTVALMNSGYPL